MIGRLALGTILLLTPAAAHPQGCAQCKDNAAATPPATQAAYREAIFFLGGTAAALFTATLLILKRNG